MSEFLRAVAFGAGASISYLLFKLVLEATGVAGRAVWLAWWRTKSGISRQAQLNVMAASLGDPSQIKPSSVWNFTPDWTDQERVKLCILFTHVFRDDFTAGRYGLPGRPNVQSLHELLQLSAMELETHRQYIDVIAYAHENHLDTGEVLKAVFDLGQA